MMGRQFICDTATKKVYDLNHRHRMVGVVIAYLVS